MEEKVIIEGKSGEKSRGQAMEDGLRWFSYHFFRPFLWFFTHLHISPNSLTIIGMAFACASGYLIAKGKIPYAAILFALSGVFDIIDGYVAKTTGNVTVFGSFLDSFSDRISDAAIYIGLSIYYLERSQGLYVGVALSLLVMSFLISYVRARAESLGATGKAGIMARGPRFLVLGFGLFFNGLGNWILKAVSWVLFALLLETLVERIVKVWRELEGSK